MAASASRTPSGAPPGVLSALREAQSRWAITPARARLEVVRRARQFIAERAESFVSTASRPAAETLSAEVLPLAEACRFLERNAERLLKPRPVRGAPLWLRTVRMVIHREPCGLVLILGPGNYPLFLPGVQLLQALTAGNAVLLKPGRGGTPAAAMLLACLYEAGLPREVVGLLDESPESAQDAMRSGVDKVVLTGSSDTGRAVLRTLAPRLTPATMELSGDDPVFVLAGADVSLAAAAIQFGMALNGGNTSIRPRRVFADPETLAGPRALGAAPASWNSRPYPGKKKRLRRRPPRRTLSVPRFSASRGVRRRSPKKSKPVWW